MRLKRWSVGIATAASCFALGPVAVAEDSTTSLAVLRPTIPVTAYVDGALALTEYSAPLSPQWAIWVDGETWSPLGPHPRPVEPGRHVVEYVHDCFEPTSVAIEVADGEQAVADLHVVERTQPLVVALEFDEGSNMELSLFTRLGFSENQRRWGENYRLLGTIRSGDVIDVPVCIDEIVAMNDRLVARPIPDAAWQVGQVTLRDADVRRRDTYGDCYQQIVHTCHDYNADSRGHEEIPSIFECEIRPRQYLGYGFSDYHDLDGDGVVDKKLTFYTSSTPYLGGSLVLSGEEGACARYVGPFATREERVMDTRHHGLRDLQQMTTWSWVEVLQFDGTRYQRVKTVVCDDTHAGEDDHYTPDAPECQGW